MTAPKDLIAAGMWQQGRASTCKSRLLERRLLKNKMGTLPLVSSLSHPDYLLTPPSALIPADKATVTLPILAT